MFNSLSSPSSGGTLAITGTYLLVTFAPHTSTHITAQLVQYYAVSWHFLLYLVRRLLRFIQSTKGVDTVEQWLGTVTWQHAVVY